jgi:ferric iron reductase protein FhuF
VSAPAPPGGAPAGTAAARPSPAAARPSAAAALAAVQARVPHLRGRVGPAGADELPATRLIGDGDALLALVRSTGAGRDAPDDAVAASLFLQAYAYRVAGTTLACAAVAGVAPDPSAGAVAVALARHRPAAVTYLGDATVAGSALDERLFAQHLEPIVAATRARVALGERLVWGNVAAAVVAAARAVAGAAADPAVWAWFDAWLAAAPHGLAALGTGGAAAYRRRTCCLWWKAGGGGLCADCPLDRPPDAPVGPAEGACS